MGKFKDSVSELVKKIQKYDVAIRKMQLILLTVLLLLMPYHYLVFAVLLKNIPILKLWRDFTIVAIFLLGVIRKRKVVYNSIFFVNIGFILLNIVYIILSPKTMQALNITRVYLLPILLFNSVKDINLKKEEICKIGKMVMCNTVLLCTYGIFQAYVLKAPFLIKLGYKTNSNGMLSASYYLSNYGGNNIGRKIQRVVSTFSAANICSFYLCSIFIVFLFARDYLKINKKIYIAFLTLVFLTIVLTFSRSSWLAIAVALVIAAIPEIIEIIKDMKYVFIGIIILLIGMIMVVEPLRDAIKHIFVSSLSGTDTSITSHSNTMKNAFKLIKDNLFGLGLGVNGPRALNYGASNMVESSILLMIFEYGIIGAVLYFYNYVYGLIRGFINRNKNKKLFRNILCFVIFTIIAYINIPYVQEIECTSLFFIYTGVLVGVLGNEEKMIEKRKETVKDE